MIKRILIVSAVVFSQFAYAELNDAAVKVQWGYKGNTGPIHWGELSSDFAVCSSGKTQSPIDIPRKTMKQIESLEIHYEPAPLVIMDDGPTELMIGKNQTIINDGHGIQVNFKAADKEFITFNQQQYHLVQFHFHSPSENAWHGQAFPLEVHFVHQGPDGQLAVIGVFIKGGASNPAIEKIVSHLPSEEGKAFPIKDEAINPLDLLPSDRRLYSFAGSLTTPPCSEGVHWFMMAEPITATPAQIVELRKAAGGVNARPIQPLHGRVINYSTP